MDVLFVCWHYAGIPVLFSPPRFFIQLFPVCYSPDARPTFPLPGHFPLAAYAAFVDTFSLLVNRQIVCTTKFLPEQQ